MSTPAYDVQHWAWAAFGRSFDAWLARLPTKHDAHHADYLDQIDMFFAAHPDGWDRHPDDPQLRKAEDEHHK